MKKTLMVIAFFAIGLTVQAQSGSFGDNLTWRFSGGTLTISGNGAIPRLSVSPWYAHIGSITRVIIENGITDIGDNAFSGHSRMTSVTIPSSVTRIGVAAFQNCTALTAIVIPDSVTSLGVAGEQFADCTALASATIGSGITRLTGRMFANTSLTEITIPEGITYISNSFTGCAKLTTVYYNAANVENHVLMGDKPFTNCNALKTVIFGDSVRHIPDHLFFGQASLETVIIGNGVTHIGESAFHNASRLSSVTLGNSIIDIGMRAFMNCASLRSITIPDSVTTIRGGAFEDCRTLSSVTLGGGITQLFPAAFTNTAITEITIPESVTTMDNSFVRNPRLRTVYWNAENHRDFASLAAPFRDCRSLSEVVFGDRVRRIPNSLFAGVSTLEKITIGSRVTEIGNEVFAGNADIMEIISRAARPPRVGYRVFEGVDTAFCTLEVPNTAASINAYKSAAVWSGFQFN